MNAPSRLRLDGSALADNWRALARLSGSAACGAAVKADGYGLGAREVVQRLAGAGCRDFFVASWAEAVALGDLGVSLSVLHGVRAADLPLAGAARPVLNSPEQVQRWREAGGGDCDVMVDTGMNRLGVAPADVAAGLLDGRERTPGQSIVLGGTVRAETVVVRTLTIGDELYRQATVAIYDDVAVPGFPKALVGMAAFENRRLALDLGGPGLFVERPMEITVG